MAFLNILKKIIIYFFLSSLLLVFIYRFINPPVTLLMIRRLADQKMDGKPLRLKKDWVSINAISPFMVQAVIAAEDNNFAIHRGIDFKAIQQAQQINKRSKRLHGASTISQQTAKNVFLWPRRSYIRKGFEAYFTVLMEMIWSKKRVMEVYLNVVELGNGIYGVEAASQFYFHKGASGLSMYESALLASILPSPRKRDPAHPSPYLSGRGASIISMMQRIGKVEL